jgi:hypothetical protein
VGRRFLAGQAVAAKRRIERTQALAFSMDETSNVGVDGGTPIGNPIRV